MVGPLSRRAAAASSQVPSLRPGIRLALDAGSARIGVARSDPGGVLATPLATVPRGPGWLDAVSALVSEHQPIEVIVGLPVSLSGRAGQAVALARRFAAELAARIAPVPVRLVDERFTTVQAHAVLRGGGRDARARRSVVDQAAAALLLQTALDAERSTGHPAGELVRSAGGGGT